MEELEQESEKGVALKSAFDHQANSISEFQNKLKDITDLQKQVNDLTNNKDNLDKELKQKQQQILNHKCDTPNGEELNQLKEDLKKANEEKEELERKLNEPIPSQEKEEDTKDLSIEELRTKLNEKNIVIGKLKARLDKMETEAKNNPNVTQNSSKRTTALVLISDDKPFKVKTLNEKGEEPDAIVFEETDFIKMMGIKADQVKILRRQICSGVKASEKYTGHNVYSHLPSEVKHLTFKDGRGGGYFFTHADAEVKSGSVRICRSGNDVIIYDVETKEFMIFDWEAIE
ncbi:23150_t:CDS:2, partial [Racocetra persica]